jgi:hypothetical protein
MYILHLYLDTLTTRLCRLKLGKRASKSIAIYMEELVISISKSLVFWEHFVVQNLGRWRMLSFDFSKDPHFCR